MQQVGEQAFKQAQQIASNQITLKFDPSELCIQAADIFPHLMHALEQLHGQEKQQFQQAFTRLREVSRSKNIDRLGELCQKAEDQDLTVEEKQEITNFMPVPVQTKGLILRFLQDPSGAALRAIKKLFLEHRGTLQQIELASKTNLFTHFFENKQGRYRDEARGLLEIVTQNHFNEIDYQSSKGLPPDKHIAFKAKFLCYPPFSQYLTDTTIHELSIKDNSLIVFSYNKTVLEQFKQILIGEIIDTDRGLGRYPLKWQSPDILVDDILQADIIEEEQGYGYHIQFPPQVFFWLNEALSEKSHLIQGQKNSTGIADRSGQDNSRRKGVCSAAQFIRRDSSSPVYSLLAQAQSEEQRDSILEPIGNRGRVNSI